MKKKGDMAVTVFIGEEKYQFWCVTLKTETMSGGVGKVYVTGLVAGAEVFSALCDYYVMEVCG